eukprot:763817-Hanusia_phi.AAC.5
MEVSDAGETAARERIFNGHLAEQGKNHLRGIVAFVIMANFAAKIVEIEMQALEMSFTMSVPRTCCVEMGSNDGAPDRIFTIELSFNAFANWFRCFSNLTLSRCLLTSSMLSVCCS